MDIAGLVQSYGYLAVAVGAFLEGESVLLVAGALANRGHLSLSWVIAVGAAAGFAGDQFYFILGRRYGHRLLARFPWMQPRTERMNRLLERYQWPLIFAIRFLYGLRVAGPIAIGMSDIPWFRFLVLNLLGAVAWALLIAGLGYWTGHGLAYVLQALDADELWGLAIVLVGAVVWWMYRRRR